MAAWRQHYTRQAFTTQLKEEMGVEVAHGDGGALHPRPLHEATANIGRLGQGVVEAAHGVKRTTPTSSGITSLKRQPRLHRTRTMPSKNRHRPMIMISDRRGHHPAVPRVGALRGDRYAPPQALRAEGKGPKWSAWACGKSASASPSTADGRRRGRSRRHHDI
jgi:hypothetical protein